MIIVITRRKSQQKKRCWWWCCLRKRKLVPLLLVQLMFLKLPISCLFSVSCVWACAPSNNNDYNDSHINIHTLYCSFLYEDQKLHGKLHWYNILAIFLVPSFTVFWIQCLFLSPLLWLSMRNLSYLLKLSSYKKSLEKKIPPTLPHHNTTLN